MGSDAEHSGTDPLGVSPLGVRHSGVRPSGVGPSVAEPPSHKVLIVTYYFPPSGGPGVQRMLKFTRYLPQFGWKPLVLTVPRDAEFPVRDPSLEEEIPDDAVVVRSGITEFYDLYRRFTRAKSTDSIDIQTVSREGGGMRYRFARWLRGAVFVPDGRIGWLRPGVAEGSRIIAAEKPDAILATGPPFTAMWIGRRLAARHGLPLVLDFRDPWTRANFYPSRPGFAKGWDERLEASCLRAARRIVSVNEEIIEDFRDRIPDVERERYAIIPNGYDPADLEGASRLRESPTGESGRRARPSGRRSIRHIGSIFTNRIPWTFLDVLEAWSRDRNRGHELEFLLAGRVAPELNARVEGSLLSNVVTDAGYVSHDESLRLMMDAGLLLLLTGEGATSKGMLTGKIFEYMASGPPILALTNEGEASQLLRETGTGFSVPPRDAEGITAALDRWWDSGHPGPESTPPRRPELIERYSRPSQARDLAEILERVQTG